MRSLDRGVLLVMIPVNLLLVAWAWGGRLLLGVGGWFLLIMLAAVPFALLALVITSVLALLQPSRPRRLSRPQTVAQLLVWAGLFGIGLFLVDFGDTSGSDRSAFTQLVGRNDLTLGLSWLLLAVSAVAVVVAWVVLLVLLVAGRRGPARPGGSGGAVAAQPSPGETRPVS